MLDEILPPGVVVEEARADVAGDAVLFPQERAVLGRAVEQRRREFSTARACAHRALARLGVPAQAIPAGPRGEPRWPLGIVGSITHCAGYRACALARVGELIALGIDAEPAAPLPHGVLAAIARPDELGLLRERTTASPLLSWDRLLFSAKECVYKAWYPLTEQRLGFADAAIRFGAADGAHADMGGSRTGCFSARLLVTTQLATGRSLTTMHGRWLARDGLLLTAIAVAA